MDLTNLFEAIIALIVAIITTFLIPWLKTKVSAEKLLELQKWVTIAVQAAEMMYTDSGMGDLKKRYVEEFLISKGFKLDYDTLNNLIESAVLELKKGVETDGI